MDFNHISQKLDVEQVDKLKKMYEYYGTSYKKIFTQRSFLIWVEYDNEVFLSKVRAIVDLVPDSCAPTPSYRHGFLLLPHRNH